MNQPAYPSRSSLEKHPWSKMAIVIVACLVIADLALGGLLGYRWWKLYSQNRQEKTDAAALKESAKQWQASNSGFWPEPCIVDPGTPKLCEDGKDRDAIVAQSKFAAAPTNIFVIDGEFIEGDITKNSLITYGLSKNILILVNKSKCFQGKEVISGSEFTVIYNHSTKQGKVAACV